MDFVSWDYDIPNCFWKVIKLMFQTTNQLNISTNFGWLEANSPIKILPSFHVNVFWRLGPKWKSWEISKCWMEPTREVQNHHRSAMSIWFKTTDNVWSNYYGTLIKHINMIDSECFLLVAKLKKWGPYFDGGKWPLYEKETCGYCTLMYISGTTTSTQKTVQCIAVERFGAGFQGRRRLFRIFGLSCSWTNSQPFVGKNVGN